jgi:hypothetical protein
MREFDETILRRNILALVSSLSDLEVICAYLEEVNVFTHDACEDVLSTPARRDRATRLVDRLRRGFRSGFPWFCRALELTRQFELLELLDGEGEARNIANEWGKGVIEVKAQTVDAECKVCHHFERSVVLFPCRHLCSCFGCSKKKNICPVCQSFVVGRINGRL